MQRGKAEISHLYDFGLDVSLETVRLRNGLLCGRNEEKLDLTILTRRGRVVQKAPGSLAIKKQVVHIIWSGSGAAIFGNFARG